MRKFWKHSGSHPWRSPATSLYALSLQHQHRGCVGEHRVLLSLTAFTLCVLAGFSTEAMFHTDWRWCSVTPAVGCAPSCSWRAAGVSTSWTPCSPGTCPSSGRWTTTIRSCCANTGRIFLCSCRDCSFPPRQDGWEATAESWKVTSSVLIHHCHSLGDPVQS